MRQLWFLLLLVGLAQSRREPTRPAVLTGGTSCLAPIRAMTCVRETRSFFVAGLGPSLGDGFGVKSVCSDAGVNTYVGMGFPFWQKSFDMSNLNSVNFPKNASGLPDLNYYMPYGSLITQMIVLHAVNPWGAAWGTIPAVIFGYLNSEANGRLDFATCGNAAYAMAYLYPNRYPLPPTMVTLKAQYTNPLSEELPIRFLADFSGKCSIRGSGYLGGDPNTSSKDHLLAIKKVCFAPVVNYTLIIPPPPAPAPQRVYGNYDGTTSEYQPCFYNKKASKPGGGGTTWSCVESGTSIATGKYGAIHPGRNGRPMDWEVDETTGKVMAVEARDIFMGDGFVQPAVAPPMVLSTEAAVAVAAATSKAQ